MWIAASSARTSISSGASQKLATVFRASFKAEDYRPLLNLGENEQILYVQAVGYPK